MLKGILVVIAIIGIHNADATEQINLQIPDEEFQSSLRESAWKMYKQLLTTNSDRNFVFSPLSIEHVMGMLFAGARGETARQIHQFLALSSYNGNEYILQQFKKLSMTYFDGLEVDYPTMLGNRVYLAEGFTPKLSYQQTLEQMFSSQYGSLDVNNPLQAANDINKWVNDMTKGMIPEIAEESDIESLTAMVLINALYFEAKWINEFENLSQGLKWYSDWSEYRMIPGMETTGEFYYIDEDASRFEYFAIPYDVSDMDVFFVVVVPKRRHANAMNEFNSEHTSESIQQALNGLKRSDRDEGRWIRSRKGGLDKLRMPLFKIDSALDASTMLKSLGVRDMFDESRADFSGVIDLPPLFVSHVKHKAKIDVNLKGTKAAAATAAFTLQRSAFVPRKKVFNINQPFFFGIYQANNFIFMGNYINPPQ